MQHGKTLLAAGVLLSLTALNAQATLSDNGNGTVYDSTLNVTWTKDANLLGTWEGAYGSTSYTNIVNAIIANDPIIHDTNNGFDNNGAGQYQLSARDFGSGGTVDYWAAQAYVSYLNSLNNGAGYDGSNHWGLPTTSPVNGSSFNDNYSTNGTTDEGYNITSTQSQLAFLNNAELHDPNYNLPNGSVNPNWTGTAPAGFQNAAQGNAADSFINLQSYAYWSGTEYASYPSHAWHFGTNDGYPGQLP